MRNLKKIVSLVLALMMVMSMMVTASAAFDDVESGNKYVEAIDVMAELGILQGKGDGVFDPNGTLKRTEAAVILSKVKSGPDYEKVIEKAAAYAENPFSDVPAWAVPYVLYCHQAEIVGGVGGGKYDANGTLTGRDFAKMLLIAAGFGVHADYVADENKSYEAKVLEMAKKADLLDGLDITLNAPITREQAAHMALNAMKAGMTSATTYDVYNKDGKFVTNFDNALDAFLYAQILEGKVELNTSATGGLLADLWNVVYTENGVDNYGRVADTYEFYNAKGELVNKLAFNTPAAYKTYTNDVAAATYEVATLKAGDLKDYAFEDEEVKVWVDGVYSIAADTVENVVAGLTSPNTVVEVYANSSKKVTSIVAINTYYEVVGEATVNNVKYATFGEDFALPYSTSGLKKDDVVAYTKYNGNLDNYTKLEGFEGTLTSVTSAGQYVINGQSYGLDMDDAAATDLLVNVMANGLKRIYYVGANNTIVLYHAPGTPTATPDPVYNNFALVTNTGFIKTGSTSTGNALRPGSSTTYAGAVELLLADGKKVELAIEILQAPATGVKVNNKLVVAANAYYYVVGDRYETIDVTGVTETEKGTLDALMGKIVAYENDAIVYASESVKDGASGNVYAVVNDTITTTTTIIGGDKEIIVNPNTVIVHKVVNPLTGDVSYAAVKGQASVGKGVKAEYVIYSTTYNATTKAYTNVAQVIYAHNSTLSFDAVAPETADYVWNSNYYSVSYDTYGALVYTYSMLKTDGTWTIVETDAPLVQYCIYELLDNGEVALVADNVGKFKTVFGTIGVVSGNTIKVVDLYSVEDTSSWILTSEKTVVCGNITVGSDVYYVDVDDNNIVDVMFIFAE